MAPELKVSFNGLFNPNFPSLGFAIRSVVLANFSFIKRVLYLMKEHEVLLVPIQMGLSRVVRRKMSV